MSSDVISRIMAVTGSHSLMVQKDKGRFMPSFLGDCLVEIYLAIVI